MSEGPVGQREDGRVGRDGQACRGTRRRADPERNWDFLKGFVLQGNECRGSTIRASGVESEGRSPIKKCLLGKGPGYFLWLRSTEFWNKTVAPDPRNGP